VVLQYNFFQDVQGTEVRIIRDDILHETGDIALGATKDLGKIDDLGSKIIIDGYLPTVYSTFSWLRKSVYVAAKRMKYAPPCSSFLSSSLGGFVSKRLTRLRRCRTRRSNSSCSSIVFCASKVPKRAERRRVRDSMERAETRRFVKVFASDATATQRGCRAPRRRNMGGSVE